MLVNETFLETFDKILKTESTLELEKLYGKLYAELQDRDIRQVSKNEISTKF